MIWYVLGFAFAPALERVVLIEKKRPAWQAGRINGVGGHIEPGETALVAMVREFEEETGVRQELWTHRLNMLGPEWHMAVFSTVLTSPQLGVVHSTTDELVLVCWHDRLPESCLRNVHWLVPMMLDDEATGGVVRYHSVAWSKAHR